MALRASSRRLLFHAQPRRCAAPPRARLQAFVQQQPDAQQLEDAHERSWVCLKALDDSKGWANTLLPAMSKFATLVRPGLQLDDVQFLQRWNSPQQFFDGLSCVGEVCVRHACGDLEFAQSMEYVSPEALEDLRQERSRFPAALKEAKLVSEVRLTELQGPTLVDAVMSGDSSLVMDAEKRRQLLDEHETEQTLQCRVTYFALLECARAAQPGVRLGDKESLSDLQSRLEDEPAAGKDSAAKPEADKPEADKPEADPAAKPAADQAGDQAEGEAEKPQDGLVDVLLRADILLECQFSLKQGLVGEFVGKKITFKGP